MIILVRRERKIHKSSGLFSSKLLVGKIGLAPYCFRNNHELPKASQLEFFLGGTKGVCLIFFMFTYLQQKCPQFHSHFSIGLGKQWPQNYPSGMSLIGRKGLHGKEAAWYIRGHARPYRKGEAALQNLSGAPWKDSLKQESYCGQDGEGLQKELWEILPKWVVVSFTPCDLV